MQRTHPRWPEMTRINFQGVPLGPGHVERLARAARRRAAMRRPAMWLYSASPRRLLRRHFRHPPAACVLRFALVHAWPALFGAFAASSPSAPVVSGFAVAVPGGGGRSLTAQYSSRVFTAVRVFRATSKSGRASRGWTQTCRACACQVQDLSFRTRVTTGPAASSAPTASAPGALTAPLWSTTPTSQCKTRSEGHRRFRYLKPFLLPVLSPFPC